MAANKFRLALVQLAVGANKAENLQRATSFVREAVTKGKAQLVALPECFNSPYGIDHFPAYAESIPDGESSKALSACAKENNVFLIGGSIPEREGDKLYNTCTVWNPSGDLVARFRKVHLFDIDIPGKITFSESKALSPGNELVTFDMPGLKVGLGICYDLRFAEIAQLYAAEGCQLLVYPGAFNMTTGPIHWEPLQVGRALDNQLYVAAVSPARVESAGYVAWGHSTVVDPIGKIVAKAGSAEEIVYTDIDLEHMKSVRSQIPVTFQRRKDLYSIQAIKPLK